VIAAALALATLAAQADVILTNTEHFSDGGGVWNDHSSSNWAIWYREGIDPASDDVHPFLNEPAPLNFDITIPDGTTTYVLYKNTYNTTDVNNVFHFRKDALTGTITIPGVGPYRSTSDPVPAIAGASLTLGDTTVSVLSFGWYHPSVFGKDFVNTNQNPTPGSGLDDIAMVTFRVTGPAIPEPSALAGLAAALGPLLLARRRAAPRRAV